MKNTLFLTFLVSTVAFSQYDFEILEFNKGKYSNIPFNYPSILSEVEVSRMVNSVEEISDEEIAFIFYLPVEGIEKLQNSVSVMTCLTELSQQGKCTEGHRYVFEKNSQGWELQPEIGGWIE